MAASFAEAGIQVIKELKVLKPIPPALKESDRAYNLMRAPVTITPVLSKPVKRIPSLSRMIPEISRKPNMFK